MNGPGDDCSHPLLHTWRTRLRRQQPTGGSDRGLLDRITWAIDIGRLTPQSYGRALDRALTAVFAQLKGLPVIEIDVACTDPGLLPATRLGRHADIDIGYSYLDETPTPWPATDIDLIEVTVTTEDGNAGETVGRVWAAPDSLNLQQARYYDLLRADRMTPAQALARARRIPGRSVQTGHARRRPVRRRSRLRHPCPHPALAHWVRTLTVDTGADQDLLAQLRWATSVTGYLTRQAYTDAAHRAIAAARSTGERGRLLTAGTARTDLLPHRQPIAVIEAHPGPSLIDRVIIYRSGGDTPAGVAWALPAGIHQHQAESYESYRAAGLSMREAYRQVST